MRDRPVVVLAMSPVLCAGLVRPAQLARLRALASRARYFHLKNFRPNPDGGPLLPGGSLECGVLDYRAILAAAFDAGYAGPLAIEFLSWDPLPIEEKLAADATFLRALLADLGRASLDPPGPR